MPGTRTRSGPITTTTAASSSRKAFRDDQFLNLKIKNNCFVWRNLDDSAGYFYQYHKPFVFKVKAFPRGRDKTSSRKMILPMILEAVVEYEYKAEQEDELNLKVGDVISNVQTAEGGWWEGELNGKKGMFPENFVKLVKRRESPPSKKEEKQIATQRKSVRELANKFKDGVPMGAPPKKKEKKKKCKVLFEYKRENDDELDLNVGDFVEFHKQVEEGWWEGSINGKHGVFPSNFVEMVEESGSSEETIPSAQAQAPAPVAPPAVPAEEKDKPNAAEKEEFQAIRGKKVVGVGLGNIFGSGPIKLRSTADGKMKEEPARPAKPGDTDPAPEAAKREKANTLERAVVRFSYNAEQPDELSLEEGQVVRILEKELEDDGWWKGEVNGKVGVFPDNFVELVPPEEPSRPKKPPPPAASSKHVYPKLPEKTSVGDGEEKSKPEHSAPALSKKPQAPPPIGKKPSAKPEPPLPARPATSLKDHKTSGPSKDSKTPSAPASSRENHTVEYGEQEGQFEGIEPSAQKLTHLTANRAKGPKKRPPSTVLTLNEGEVKEEAPPEPPRPGHSHLADKSSLSQAGSSERPHPPPSSHKDKHPHTEQAPPSLPSHPPPSHAAMSSSHHRDIEPSSGPPPRPPEPSTAPPSASNTQTNKLLEQLQRELQELKANSVSKAAFNELRAEHDRLKLEFENFKNHHTKKLRDVILEVDEEKKLRLTTEVEIQRVKKWMAETNV
ncbi:SH3 domain-containing kinase-binding protein 1 [Aplysia californica]|uniref:SH3 domain-containing kinase-binding protein 1 n=1 Tax=Aplysia californica TaxID=6500 RepID=A0ABM1AAE8_APLCA|nr:SH3 domain-containing kinase-binding protein 1 [Aplysia californica]